MKRYKIVLIFLQRKPAPSEEKDEEDDSEFKLPQALEKVLAFKDVRAQQVGVKPEDVDNIEQGEKGVLEHETQYLNFL